MPNPRPACEGEGSALPLLLLPGTLCNARVFEPLRMRLPGIVTEVRALPRVKSMRQAAETLLAEAPQRFAVLGFSLGGMVALEMALRAPERVLGLALISTNASSVPLELHGPRRDAVELARSSGLRQFVRDHLWPGYSAVSGCNESLFQEMAESLGQEVFAQQTELALGRDDFRPRLGAVRCPALVLAGLEDRLCPPPAQQEMAGALLTSTLVLLPGTGHLAMLEKADDVAAAVAAWFHTNFAGTINLRQHAAAPWPVKETE